MKAKGDIAVAREAELPRARRFVDSELRRELGIGPEVRLDVRPAVGGGKSVIFLVLRATEGDSVSEGIAVVQLFDRAGGSEHRRLIWSLGAAGRKNAPTPRLIHAQRFSMLRSHAFVAMTFAKGRAMTTPPTEPEAEALAQALARLHAIHSADRGKPENKLTKRSGTNMRGWATDSANSTVASLDKAGLDSEVLERIRETVNSTLAKAVKTLDRAAGPSQAPYHFCHGHLAPDDVLFDEQTGGAMIIDCSSLEFSRATRDLASVRLEFFGADSSGWDAWLERYLQLAPDGFGGTVENELPFFTAWALARKIRRALEKGADIGPRLETWNLIFGPAALAS